MVLILFLLFGAAILVLLVTRFTLTSVFIASSCIYCLPAFWLGNLPDRVALAWCLVFAAAIVSQLTSRQTFVDSDTRDDVRPNTRSAYIVNLTFNASTSALFIMLVYLIGGIGIFFKGKYGGAAGHQIIYYSWNSILLLTAIHNLYFRRFTNLLSLFALFQIFLLFVGGDRTIPILYLVAVVYRYFHGMSPLAMPKRARVLMFLSPFILPLALVSKSLYTVLPHHGFTAQTAELVMQNFSSWAVKDFEPSHTMVMFNSIALHGLPYHWSDLLHGLPAIFPFSTYLGVNEHLFSQIVKARYFPTWGAGAGVGANFWAEGYALSGLTGVALFAAVVLLSLRYLERAGNRTQSSALRATYLACGVIIGFYVHRNSLEQILAFVGRYATLGILVALLAHLASSSARSRELRLEQNIGTAATTRLARPAPRGMGRHV